MFKVPETNRVTTGIFSSDKSFGNNGVFKFDYEDKIIYCIASDGSGWEHVSISIRGDKIEIPSWNIMNWIKNIFWGEDDIVIQIHPAKKDYINNHVGVLHLWRPIDKEIPVPDTILIGFKDLNIE
jgi:hypothetical protein